METQRGFSEESRYPGHISYLKCPRLQLICRQSYLCPVSTLPASDLATEPLVEEVELLDREPPAFMIEVGEDLQHNTRGTWRGRAC